VWAKKRSGAGPSEGAGAGAKANGSFAKVKERKSARSVCCALLAFEKPHCACEVRIPLLCILHKLCFA
jgi:hypothetical protein